MEVASFAEIESEFLNRVGKVVWCNMATIDTKNRPRSRIVHPFWEGATGWITTRRGSFKGKHIEQNPYLSLAYIADLAKPVYVDCKAEWLEDVDEKRRIWDLIKETPPPVGFDPAPIYESVDHPNFGILELTPWRIEVATVPTSTMIWRQQIGVAER